MNCCICGNKFEKKRWYEPFADVCSSECYSEKFWRIMEEEHKINPFIIINGYTYVVGNYIENPKDSHRLGHGGREFVIIRDDGITIKTNNLWCQGSIPENHRGVLKDNAKFAN